MSYSALPLRPLGVGDLLDETVRLYRRYFLLFVGIGAVVAVPSIVIQLAPLLAANVASEDAAIIFGVMYVILALLFGLAYLITFAAMVHAVSEACLGHRLTINAAYDRGLRRFGSLLGLSIVYTLAIFVLFITIVGWIYFAVAWGFAYHALLLEGLGIRAALGRSRALVRGSWWRVFGITLLVFIFVGIISTLFSLLSAIPAGIAAFSGDEGTGFIIGLVISTIISVASQVILAPLTYVAWTLLYYDLRVRKEGFDLELLARELEAPNQLDTPRG